MAVTTRSPRRPALLLGAVALTGLLVIGGCSSSKDDATGGDATTSTTVPSPTQGTTATTASGTGSGTATTATPTTAGTSASSVPGSIDGTCTALAETYGLDDLQPKNTASWVDERQRIVVDAQREAALLTTAQQGAPAEVGPRLATMAAYASWMANAMQGSGSFSEAVAAVDGYPDLVTVSLAVASVQTWQKANCPD